MVYGRWVLFAGTETQFSLSRTRSRLEAECAAEAIHRNFKLEARVYDKKNKGFALFFPVAETKKLHALIKDDVLPIFNYKLSLTP